MAKFISMFILWYTKQIFMISDIERLNFDNGKSEQINILYIVANRKFNSINISLILVTK